MGINQELSKNLSTIVPSEFLLGNSYPVIISADWHVGIYNAYNPTKYFRLNQFDLLADKVIETAKEYGAKELWILGDLLVTPKSPSEVLHKLKQVFRKITNEGIIIRFIYGNHDLKIKRIETSLERYESSTLLSVLADNDKVFAYTSEVVTIAGKLVHFESWRPKNEISEKSPIVQVIKKSNSEFIDVTKGN